MKTIFFIIFLCFSDSALAHQVALSFNQGFFAMIVGLPNDGKENELKTDGYNFGPQFDGTFLLGDQHGLLVGFAQGTVYEGFSYKPTNAEKEYFESDYKYRGIKLGGWIHGGDGDLIQANLVYAKGDFHFFGKKPVVEGRQVSASMLEMEVRGVVSFFEAGKVKVDFLGGFKIFKIFLPEFSYNGRTHPSHEDQNDSKFQFMIGLGFRNILEL